MQRVYDRDTHKNTPLIILVIYSLLKNQKETLICYLQLYGHNAVVYVMSLRAGSFLVWLFTSVGERFGIMDANIW